MPWMWSACACVKRTASTRSIRFVRAWNLKSVVVSTNIYLLAEVVISIDDLVLLFFGSSELQTAHLQPITGTPVEVPEQRNSTFIIPMHYPVLSTFLPVFHFEYADPVFH